MGQTASSGQHGRTEGCFTAGIGLGCCSDVCDGAACGWCYPATDRAGKRLQTPRLMSTPSSSLCNLAAIHPVGGPLGRPTVPTESDPGLADKRSVHDIRLQEAAEFGKGLKEVARHAAHAVVREDRARKAARHDPRLNVATHQITGKRNLTHDQQNTAPKSKHGNHSHTTHPTRAHGHP